MFEIIKNEIDNVESIKIYDVVYKIGEKYGNSTIIGYRTTTTGKDKDGGALHLRCKCGKEFFMKFFGIKRGRGKHCGCITPDTVFNIGQNFVNSKIVKFLGKIEESHNNFWELECVCGKLFSVSTSRLGTCSKGVAVSCGCKHNTKLDLTNKRFGRGVVISKFAVKNWVGYWNMKCDCGKEYIARTNTLMNGSVKSCGCLKEGPRTDLIGKKFGKGTVIAFCKEKSRSNGLLWLVECECGNKYKASNYLLTRQLVNSCGCLGMNKEGKYFRKRTIERYLTLHKQSAFRRGIEFNITNEYAIDLLEKQLNKCALSGLPIDINNGTASLDRIDSSKGYLEDNIQWVFKVYNFMKLDLNQDDFIRYCCLVADNQKNK